MDIYWISIIILLGLGVFGLVVGVSNDAVNFLNSSIGSRVASRNVIMIIASLGMLVGVTFSSGMMEVARKGIFNPQYFLMPELVTIFLAVMITNVVILDLFNTFGLPTSTTVSIVFGLLGAAVAASLAKIYQSGDSLTTIVTYINSGKALFIIFGILLSVVIAFFCGAIVQLITRLIFTFKYEARFKRYGSIWGGISLSAITYFILIKGAKGSSFITPETLVWIKENTWIILVVNFLIFTLLFQIMISFMRINILKLIVLIGTFAMAMAFTANDLVNFIGVPLAGLNAYTIASASGNPLSATMEALQRPVQSNTALLLIAGLIMVTTLWVSKKARTVIKTEVNLGRQGEGVENFGSSALSRVIVRMVTAQSDLLKKVTPHALRRIVAKRLNPDAYVPVFSDAGKPPSFDLLRASVNLIVASAVVSFATSMKLPLSTTYVTFMVAMGTSFSDQAWGRENAVYRVNGVLTVIGGWFVTALVAFSISFLFAVVIYFCELPGAIFLLVLSILLVWRNYRLHFKREEDEKRIEAFSLKTIVDSSQAVKTSFEQAAFFLKEVSQNLDTCFEGMFSENRQKLKATRNETKKIQKWTNIIIANFFKTLYLLHKDDLEHPQKYSYTIQSLQEISESHRDIILRAYNHVENNHRGLLDVQKEELAIIRSIITRLLKDTADMLLKKDGVKYKSIDQERQLLEKRVSEFDKNQIKRIQKGESKTRLSILFYGFLENSRKISAHTLNLVDVFRDALQMMPAEMETVPKNPRI